MISVLKEKSIYLFWAKGGRCKKKGELHCQSHFRNTSLGSFIERKLYLVEARSASMFRMFVISLDAYFSLNARESACR